MILDRFFLHSLSVLVLSLGLLATPTDAAPTILHAVENGQGTAMLALDADDLVTMTTIPFRLTIRDAAGQPVTGARVRCDMTMPAMSMPENRPKVSEQNGTYVGELIFTCAMGAWRISCVAEKSDGDRQTATFDIDKVRMK